MGIDDRKKGRCLRAEMQRNRSSSNRRAKVANNDARTAADELGSVIDSGLCEMRQGRTGGVVPIDIEGDLPRQPTPGCAARAGSGVPMPAGCRTYRGNGFRGISRRQCTRFVGRRLCREIIRSAMTPFAPCFSATCIKKLQTCMMLRVGRQLSQYPC